MTSQPSGLSRLVAELRRRHVFRGTVAYAAVAFVVLQAAEIVVPAFELPSWMLQLAVVLAVLGLPVAAALAWVYEITPGGIRTMRDLDAEAGHADGHAGDLAPRVALLVVTMTAVAGAGWWWIRTSVPAESGPEAATENAALGRQGAPTADPAAARNVPVRSLAVLPLDDFSPGGDQEYFAAGMHEALISRLSQLGSVRVVSRTSVTSLDRTGKLAVQIGEELGVEGLVEGSVTVDGDSVRITVQLIHAPSDTHLWSGEYQRELRDVLGLQRDVATAIAREIEGELGEESASPVLASRDPAPAADPDAAMEEMRGRHMLVSGAPEDLERAAEHLERALQEDPGYAPTLVSLAGLTLLRGSGPSGSGSLPGEEAVASAEDYVERALESDPGSREAMELQALIDGIQRDLQGAGASGGPAGAPPTPPRTGVRILGGDSGAVVIAGDSLEHFVPTVTEIGSRVLAHVAALQAEARSAPTLLRAARNLQAAGRRDRAEEILRRSVRDFPTFVPAWDELEHLLAVQGELEAVVALRRERRDAVGPGAPGTPSLEDLEAAVAGTGARGYWGWRLQELEARREAGEVVSRVDLAAAHAALGDAEAAMEHLAAARRRGDPKLATLRSDPVWDPIRNDPDFRRLSRQVIQFRGPVPGG